VRRIRFTDLVAEQAEIAGSLTEAFARVCASGAYILGPEVERFESAFAAYCRARHCIGTGNGLDALALILRALDIGAGDEVVVPANTFIATWLAVSAVGARPVPVEPDPATLEIDPMRAAAAITPRTRAIVAVHLYGLPADLSALVEIAARHGVPLVEDAAQAHGARHGGRRVGSVGTAAAFSFYPAKNLGALGDGGAVTTADAKLAERVRILANYGSATKYRNVVRGLNSRLDALQAALLSVKLPHLDRWNASRQRLAERYRARLAARDDIAMQEVPSDCEPVWHRFTIRSRARAALQAHLAAMGIETMIHYPVPPHLQPAYAELGLERGSLAITERIHDDILSLPLRPTMRDEEVDAVADAVLAFRA